MCLHYKYRLCIPHQVCSSLVSGVFVMRFNHKSQQNYYTSACCMKKNKEPI